MIGVCIPAHNEEACIDSCLASVARAASYAGLAGEPVEVVVVLDHCSDLTAMRAAAWRVRQLTTSYRNVGLARAAGAAHLIGMGARWLAFTDADTQVGETWLYDQVELRAAVVCGTVGVLDWSSHGGHAQRAQAQFQTSYQDKDGHRHVHGANLGVSALVYQKSGGFHALACGEDQSLVDRLEQAGVSIAWTSRPRVVTSCRAYSRVEGGFATALRSAWGFGHEYAENLCSQSSLLFGANSPPLVVHAASALLPED
ncbi:glycosyltransferase family 2 protein [Pusillimonas sp. ANT_WB101]|uniref:glycosyltransferase n=1 Tax=Pusillimonas sp. ANT_WB101 TaxID=2597356 RepID=UPI0011EF43B5|nr:glycosyltransferase [Pusillimonas sp. ANT_WB101]KAA0890804.1 glycosyltransferase family 2 protein [Pusillimonas sp. ANT_WB101]